jgi:hypothetical protein
MIIQKFRFIRTPELPVTVLEANSASTGT